MPSAPDTDTLAALRAENVRLIGRGCAHDLGLHRLVVLGVLRQGQRGRIPRVKTHLFRWPDITAARSGEPLPPMWSRLLWMACIWAASITALLAVAVVLRWVLKT